MFKLVALVGVIRTIYAGDIPFHYPIARMVLAQEKKRLGLSLPFGCDANRWSDCKSVRVIPPWKLNA